MMIIKYLYLIAILIFIVNTTADAMEGAAMVPVAAPLFGEPEGTSDVDRWILSAAKAWFSSPSIVSPEVLGVTDPSIDLFVSVAKPKIMIGDYIDRLLKYLEFS